MTGIPTVSEALAAGDRWRKVFPPHPAAEIFPMMSGDDLAEQIRA